MIIFAIAGTLILDSHHKNGHDHKESYLFGKTLQLKDREKN
jgi:hypothetical protein